MFSRLLGDTSAAATLDKKFKDADGDLVADPPADAAERIDPEEINFSYVASSDAEDEEETWKELLAALEARLGKQGELGRLQRRRRAIAAPKTGELHVTAIRTGEVQGAVNEAGFVPAACFADKDGEFHIHDEDHRPPTGKQESKKVWTDLSDRRMTFVRPRSNSGCTAALVMLMKEHDLQPERDYNWGFSYGHENSIKGIAEKKFEAAAVASDILDRMIAERRRAAKDAIRDDLRVEPYPPGVIGYAYNLTPELREGIRETLLGFEWTAPAWRKTYGTSGDVKFAPVNYKDDWAAGARK